MTPKGFETGQWEVACDVCGAKYSVRFQNQLAGKNVCIMCNRYRHMVHALRYVEYMASKDCQEAYAVTELQGDMVHWHKDNWACRLDCSCDTCGARKVLKFMKAWHAARR